MTEQAGDLYRVGVAGAGENTATTLTLIPYYAWANRAPSAMQVWIPFREA
jgi:hypothetical protein